MCFMEKEYVFVWIPIYKNNIIDYIINECQDYIFFNEKWDTFHQKRCNCTPKSIVAFDVNILCRGCHLLFFISSFVFVWTIFMF